MSDDAPHPDHDPDPRTSWTARRGPLLTVALIVGIWAALALPETLAPAARRPLTAAVVLDGFRIVAASRLSLWYALAGTCIFGALVGFVSTAQQIYVGIYGLGSWFPAAFALVAALMAVSAWLNSRLVRLWGMRRLSHGALLAFTGLSALLLALSLASPEGAPPLPV